MSAPVSGNGARFAAVPIAGGGTPLASWLAADRLPQLTLEDCTKLVVVAAHPDDETLGLGATLAQLAAAGVDVEVVSATDGGGADPEASPFERADLERRRRNELLQATRLLRIPAPTSLGLPDGRLGDHEATLTQALIEILDGSPPGTWCAANWRGDGHPDHEAVGRAAASACERTGVTLVEYPIWMWHWATPGDAAVPWQRAYSVPLTRQAVGRKYHAAQCFQSQLEAAGPDTPAVVPPFVLRRLMSVGEVLFR